MGQLHEADGMKILARGRKHHGVITTDMQVGNMHYGKFKKCNKNTLADVIRK